MCLAKYFSCVSFWKVQGSPKPLICWKWKKGWHCMWNCGNDKCCLFWMVLKWIKQDCCWPLLCIHNPDSLPARFVGSSDVLFGVKNLIKWIVSAEVASFILTSEQQSQLEPLSLPYLNQDQFLAKWLAIKLPWAYFNFYIPLQMTKDTAGSKIMTTFVKNASI